MVLVSERGAFPQKTHHKTHAAALFGRSFRRGREADETTRGRRRSRRRPLPLTSTPRGRAC